MSFFKFHFTASGKRIPLGNYFLDKNNVPREIIFCKYVNNFRKEIT